LIYLLLSILFSSGIFVIFKYFGIYKVDTFKAIFVNYIVALTIGFSFAEKSFSVLEIPNQPWFLGAVFLGGLFVSIFFVMAMTAQKNGVSVASVAGKMSVVIPVLFGVYLYNESVTILKIVGIIIALIAVYLASVKEVKTTHKKVSLLFPVLLFSGSLFGIAGCFGLIVLLIKAIKKRSPFGVKNIIAGVALGVPNYYSIVFLIKALQTEGIESSTLFTINNVGIVIVSTLVGILLFKEQFSFKNKIGVALAIVGIVIVALA
jgi:drug/metabolite transporter (DMT)-like permease